MIVGGSAKRAPAVRYKRFAKLLAGHFGLASQGLFSEGATEITSRFSQTGQSSPRLQLGTHAERESLLDAQQADVHNIRNVNVVIRRIHAVGPRHRKLPGRHEVSA
jgi:hypothetical protein